MDGNVDVIVTDGFTGNIALKTAEGTANFITRNLKNSLNKLSLLFSYNSLAKFKSKLDPRKYNGAIFLGLQSPVVKSHGSTDSIGFAHSINVCNKIVKANLIEKIESNLITVDAKLSEEPMLSLEIVLAVAGATNIRSLHLDKDIWSISDSFSWLNKSS